MPVSEEVSNVAAIVMKDKPESSANDSNVVGIRGQNLIAMCESLAETENARRFKAFPEAYCQLHNLSEEETHAVTDLDIKRLIKAGAGVECLQLLCGIFELDVINLGAEQAGVSEDEFRTTLAAQGHCQQHRQ